MRTLIAAAVGLLASSVVSAQVRDTARVARPVAPASTVSTAFDSLRPPLSPRRAFFYSFLAPGYSQSVLGRHKVAAGFLLFESIAIAMIRESAADVHEARRTINDTLVVSWVDGAGHLLSVPDTLTPRFGDREVRTRQSHIEDWVAVLVANHLAAGAEAYVASLLWDVQARVGLRVAPGCVALAASIPW